MSSFDKLTRLKLPTQFSFFSATSLLSKWNHREVSLVVGSAFLIILFLGSVYYYRRKSASTPPEMKPEKLALPPPPPIEQKNEVQEQVADSKQSIVSSPQQPNDNFTNVNQISSNSSPATQKVDDVVDEFFSQVNDPAPVEKKENATPPRAPAPPTKKTKASPKKVTVPDGLVSGDHADPKFVVHYDGCAAWMKISKKGNQLTLEGLYRRSKKESGIEIADVVVAEDPHLTPLQKYFLYDYAMHIIYKYGYQFPVTPKFSIKLDTKPRIQANSPEEAALYSHFNFAPRSVKGQMKVLRDACTEEIAQKITVLNQKWNQKKPGIGDSVDVKKRLGWDRSLFLPEEMEYLEEYTAIDDTSELWLQYWSLLRTEPYPQIVEYLNKAEPPQHHVRTTDQLRLITWSDIQAAQKYEAALNSRVGWSTEYIEWPQDEGKLRIGIETHPEKKQMKMVSLEIQDKDQRWQPVSTHPDLKPETKFKLYKNVVAKLYAIEKGRLPSFKASNEHELFIFYHLGFVPNKFKDALKGSPLFMRVRATFSENKAFPLELVFRGKEYFSNWAKFQDPEFDGKEFGETLSSNYSDNDILNLSPVITFHKQENDLHTYTICCYDSAGKPVTVEMELRRGNHCVIIEKVAGLNLKDLEASAQIMSSILYVAMQKSSEWNLKGAIKARFISKENAVFFQLVQFHNPELTNRQMKHLHPDKILKRDGSPTKKMEQFLKSAQSLKIDPQTLLEPNDFKIAQVADRLKEADVLWLKGFYPKLKEHARNNNFPSFTRLVEDVFLFSSKESLAAANLMVEAGMIIDNA